MGLELSQDKDSKPVSTLKGSLVWRLVLNEAENERCVKVELDFTTHKQTAVPMVSEVKRYTQTSGSYCKGNVFLKVKPWSLTLVRLVANVTKMEKENYLYSKFKTKLLCLQSFNLQVFLDQIYIYVCIL